MVTNKHKILSWKRITREQPLIPSPSPGGRREQIRRFAVGIIQFISDGNSSVALKMQQLNRNTRLVFDYLRMTNNSTRRSLT